MKPKLLLCLALVLSGGLFGCSTAKPDADAANPLSLSIALLGSPFNSSIYADINTNFHLPVVITNNSKKPQNVLMENSSWGWPALSFELTDEKGNTYLIRRNSAVALTDNGPAYWILKPDEHYVRDVCFAEIYQGQNSWWGFPEKLSAGGYTKFTMKAIFEVVLEEATRGEPLWHGRIESPPVVCEIRDDRPVELRGWRNYIVPEDVAKKVRETTKFPGFGLHTNAAPANTK